MQESDQFLRRLERTAIVVCLSMAVVALLVTLRIAPAIAVLGGGLLIGVSYWTIGLGVHALAGAFLGPPATRDVTGGEPIDEAPSARPRTGWTLARVVLRYALLALLAYVMIARLRLHPIALLAGASSVAAAASIEAVRLLMKKPRA
jgi:hypothetical protein